MIAREGVLKVLAGKRQGLRMVMEAGAPSYRSEYTIESGYYALREAAS